MIIDPLGIVPIERGGTGATTAEEAKEKLGIESGSSSGTILFSNKSGQRGTITLNESITNYNLLELFTIKDDGWLCFKVYLPYCTSFVMYTSTVSTTAIYLTSTKIVISDTTITTSSPVYSYVDEDGFGNSSYPSAHKIYVVIGYK